MRRRPGSGRTGNRGKPQSGRRGRPPPARSGSVHRPRRRGLPVLHRALDRGRGKPPQSLPCARVLCPQKAEPAARPLPGHPWTAKPPVATGEGSGGSDPRHDGPGRVASDRHRPARPEPVPATALAHPGVGEVSQRAPYPGSPAGDRRSSRPAPALTGGADAARSRAHAHARPAGPGRRFRSGRPGSAPAWFRIRPRETSPCSPSRPG